MPTLIDRGTLSNYIRNHIKDMSSMGWRVGTSYIALMKLHQPGLFANIGPMSIMGQNYAQDVYLIRNIIEVIHGKAGKLLQFDDQLSAGGVDPSWAFAMCYASQLLISHGSGVLKDHNWGGKVANITYALDKISKRWKIAERHCESIKVSLDNHSTGYNR